MRTLILSDIHLGGRHCNVSLLNEVLDREPFDRLILNGDTLNSVNLRKLNGAHWGLLNRFRRLGRTRELVLLRGNHDHDGDHLPPYHANENGDSVTHDAADVVISTFHVLPGLLEVPMARRLPTRRGRQLLPGAARRSI